MSAGSIGCLSRRSGPAGPSGPRAPGRAGSCSRSTRPSPAERCFLVRSRKSAAIFRHPAPSTGRLAGPVWRPPGGHLFSKMGRPGSENLSHGGVRKKPGTQVASAAHGPNPPARRSPAPSVRRPPAKAGRPRGRDPYGPSTGTSTVSATASGAFVSALWPAAIPLRPGVYPGHSARGNSPGPTLCRCSCCAATRAAKRPAASPGLAANTAVPSVSQAPSSVASAHSAVCRRWRLGVARPTRPLASDLRLGTATRTPPLPPCHLLATT